MIHRDDHSEGFTQISNAILRDPTLSDGAVRLLVYMLSMADDWSFSVKTLAAYFNVTTTTIMDRVMELKRAGYIVTSRTKNERGQFTASVWDIYETPTEPDAAPHVSFSTYGKNHIRKKPHEVNTTQGFYHMRQNQHVKNINIKEDHIEKKNKGKEEKTALGDFQNVFLSSEEVRKLEEKLGAEKAGQYINNLGDYLKEHPRKHYANHYRTILNWVQRDEARSKPENVVDWDELMKKAEEADRKKAGGET